MVYLLLANTGDRGTLVIIKEGITLRNQSFLAINSSPALAVAHITAVQVNNRALLIGVEVAGLIVLLYVEVIEDRSILQKGKEEAMRSQEEDFRVNKA